MFDSLFGGGQTSKCKQLIKIVNQRLEPLRNKRRSRAARLRRDVAELLRKGRHEDASFRVGLLYSEENVLRIYDIIEMYCERVRTQLSLFQKHRNCPQDIKEAISSIIYAAARCAEIPELQALRGVFATKYGDEFAVAAVEMNSDSGVNAKMVENFNAKAPSKNDKLKLMKEIAGNAGIPWTDCYSEDASATKMSSSSGRELKSSTGCYRDMHEKDIPCLSSCHNDKPPSPNHMRRDSELDRIKSLPSSKTETPRYTRGASDCAVEYSYEAAAHEQILNQSLQNKLPERKLEDINLHTNYNDTNESREGRKSTSSFEFQGVTKNYSSVGCKDIFNFNPLSPTNKGGYKEEHSFLKEEGIHKNKYDNGYSEESLVKDHWDRSWKSKASYQQEHSGHMNERSFDNDYEAETQNEELWRMPSFEQERSAYANLVNMLAKSNSQNTYDGKAQFDLYPQAAPQERPERSRSHKPSKKQCHSGTVDQEIGSPFHVTSRRNLPPQIHASEFEENGAQDKIFTRQGRTPRREHRPNHEPKTIVETSGDIYPSVVYDSVFTNRNKIRSKSGKTSHTSNGFEEFSHNSTLEEKKQNWRDILDKRPSGIDRHLSPFGIYAENGLVYEREVFHGDGFCLSPAYNVDGHKSRKHRGKSVSTESSKHKRSGTHTVSSSYDPTIHEDSQNLSPAYNISGHETGRCRSKKASSRSPKYKNSGTDRVTSSYYPAIHEETQNFSPVEDDYRKEHLMEQEEDHRSSGGNIHVQSDVFKVNSYPVEEYVMGPDGEVTKLRKKKNAKNHYREALRQSDYSETAILNNSVHGFRDLWEYPEKNRHISNRSPRKAKDAEPRISNNVHRKYPEKQEQICAETLPRKPKYSEGGTSRLEKQVLNATPHRSKYSEPAISDAAPPYHVHENGSLQRVQVSAVGNGSEHKPAGSSPENTGRTSSKTEVAKNEASPVRSPPGRTASLPEKSPARPASQAKLLKSVSDIGVPKASHVHPKLPDYDDLTAHFAALKQQCKSSRQGQSG